MLYRENAERLLDFCKRALFCERTAMLYDHANKPASYFPTAEEIARVIPNPCGYGTGMEDCMISGGMVLDALCTLPDRTREEEAFLHLVLNGMLDNALAARPLGFLPRGRSPQDGKSYYPDTSRDQYTLFIYGCYRALRAGVCTEEERSKMREVACAFVARTEEYVTPENDYDMSCADGGASIANLLWGDRVQNHETMRLPMMYLFAHTLTGDDKYWQKFVAIRDEAIRRALPMTEYWAMYTLQQMCMSVKMVAELDPEHRARYDEILAQIAAFLRREGEGIAARLAAITDEQIHAQRDSFRDLPQQVCERWPRTDLPRFSVVHPDGTAYFQLQDCAYAPYVISMVTDDTVPPDADAVRTLNALYERIDLDRMQTNLPIAMLGAYAHICAALAPKTAL